MDAVINEYLARFVPGNADASEFPVDALQAFLASIILSREFDDKKSTKDICELLLDKYRDVWYHGIGLLKNIAVVSSVSEAEIPNRDTHLLRIAKVMRENSISSPAAVKRVFLILEKIRRPTPQVLELEPVLGVSVEKKLSYYRIQFKNCWAEFLRSCGSALDRTLMVKLLRILPDSVMPHVVNPEIFASFFSDSFNRKGDLEVSLLSVAGLFHLISRHNLGEPVDLYSRLYQLISPETMKKSAQSNRVFQMLVKALRSQLMPAQLVPVFAKRLLRVAVLVKSPSMTLWLVVTAFNLMQAHPLVSKPLIHRADSEGMTNADPFDLESDDIYAMMEVMPRTSLWELELLTQHSDPSVVRMANLFKTNFFSRKAKRISSDDYLLITDEQLFNRERKYGTHSKAKKSKGEYELDTIVGEDEVRTSIYSIPVAVHTESGAQRMLTRDQAFLKEFGEMYC